MSASKTKLHDTLKLMIVILQNQNFELIRLNGDILFKDYLFRFFFRDYSYNLTHNPLEINGPS